MHKLMGFSWVHLLHVVFSNFFQLLISEFAARNVLGNQRLCFGKFVIILGIYKNRKHSNHTYYQNSKNQNFFHFYSSKSCFMSMAYNLFTVFIHVGMHEDKDRPYRGFINPIYPFLSF